MYACPSCRTSSIPVWRAFVPDLRVFDFKCPCCGTMVRRKKSIKDFIIGIPLMGSYIYANQFDRLPEHFVIFSFGMAALAGLFCWMLTIKYKVVEDVHRFAPGLGNIHVK